MADAVIHQKQAKHNYTFLKSFISNNLFRDWQLIVAFYTVLQIIDCELTKKDPRWRAGRDMFNNETMYAWRDKLIKIHFRTIYTSYHLLLQRSKEARYLEGIGNKTAIDGIKESDVKNCLEVHLKKVLSQFSYSWH